MDGHYSLDLSNQMDKFCLNKLLELGMTIAFRRAKKRYACAASHVLCLDTRLLWCRGLKTVVVLQRAVIVLHPILHLLALVVFVWFADIALPVTVSITITSFTNCLLIPCLSPTLHQSAGPRRGGRLLAEGQLVLL
jgi:hypothetical protein